MSGNKITTLRNAAARTLLTHILRSNWHYNSQLTSFASRYHLTDIDNILEALGSLKK